jgi:hypothetical protein
MLPLLGAVGESVIEWRFEFREQKRNNSGRAGRGAKRKVKIVEE